MTICPERIAALRESTAQNNPTPDPHTGATRVYGGDTGLIHIPDGTRVDVGRTLAEKADAWIRAVATRESYLRGELSAQRNEELDALALCPGCYMTAAYNMLVELAEKNGQSLSELGFTMAGEFTKLALGLQTNIEHVEVQRV